MEVNYTLIIVAAVVQFVLGSFWYSPLMFGKIWMSIMEVSHYTKEELQKMQKSMMPFMGLQFVLTLITTWVLANNIQMFEIVGTAGTSVYWLAFFMWLGYMMPVAVSSVIFGSTKRRHWCNQIAIMCGMQFVGIMLAAFILSM
jgi:hypothetical protein